MRLQHSQRQITAGGGSATKLTTRDFGTGTRGFAASEDANMAVCVLPGTELSFALQGYVLTHWTVGLAREGHQAQDRHLSANQQRKGSGPSGCTGVSRRSDLTPDIFLCEGQQATVLQLPVQPRNARGGRFAKQGFEHQAATGVILWPG